MRKLMLGAALLGLAAPAGATTWFATMNGTVTSEFATVFTEPGATSPIKVGDTITATFSYNSGASIGEMLARGLGANLATFKLGGFTWTSRGDFLGDIAPPDFAAADPFAGYEVTTDDAPGGGDLHVQGYAFEIGEFGYDLYTGLGFSGTFDPRTLVVMTDGVRSWPDVSNTVPTAPVPEPATWAMMIGGFGLAGTALRRRKASPLTSQAA